MLVRRRSIDQVLAQVRAQYLRVDVDHQKVRAGNGCGNYVAIQLDQANLQHDAQEHRP